MIHPKTAQEAARLVQTLMHDAWNSRNFLIGVNREFVYLPYRISLTDLNKEDSYLDVYVHFVISKNRFWYTFSEVPDFRVNHDDLTFAIDGNEVYPSDKGTCYQRYLFDDVVGKALEEYLLERRANDLDMLIAIWDTFPVRNLNRV